MIARFKTYIQNIILEWQKVSKPDWDQVRGSTVVVLIASGLLGLFLWLVDGSSAQPVWKWPENIILVIIPVAVFFFGKGLENRRIHYTVVACIPLVVILITTYALNLDEPFSGWGMSFLRKLFLIKG